MFNGTNRFHEDFILPTPPIIHPCASWAFAAKQNSWPDAVKAMKEEGKVLAGTVRFWASKSMLNFTLIHEQIVKEGLDFYVDEFGVLVIGLKENFDARILAEQEELFRKLVCEVLPTKIQKT